MPTPTLVIHGDVDALVPRVCSVEVAEGLLGAKLPILKSIGHALPIFMWPRIIDAVAAHAI